MAEKKNKRNLGFGDCFCMGVGQTIGAGVITMTGTAIAMTGSGVFWAYVLAAICMFICKFPSLIMGTTIPRTSASYAYCNLLSPKLGGFYTGVSTIARVTMAFFGFSFATYFCTLVDVNPTVVGVTIVTIVFVMNLFGIKNAAKVQSIMTVILLIALTSFVVGYIGQRINRTKGAQQDPTQKSMNFVLYTMPLISLWMGFSFQIGVGIYWIFSNIFSLIQTVLLPLCLREKKQVGVGGGC